MRETGRRVLPSTRGVPNGRSFGMPRAKQLKKTCNNFKITILCGFVTILVLRGTIGVGNFGGGDAGEVSESVAKQNARVLEEIRHEPDDEEDQMQLKIDPNSTFVYSLGPKISDWDQQRETWLKENPQFPSSINGRSRILLVTGSPPSPCDNPVGDHYLLKSIKNKIDYCRLHGIEIVYNMAHLDKEMAGYWAKLPLIRRLMLSHPEVEWIWWMDSDAMFTDMVFELPLEKYKDYNFILHGWDKEIYGRKSWIGLNTGSFLLRNCQWSLDVLDAWAPMGPKGQIRDEAGRVLTAFFEGRPAFEADDQSALIYMFITQKKLWGDKVFLENSYYLHGFWVGVVDKYEEMVRNYHPGFGDDRWPFVTHFVGCKPCGSYADYPLERCLKSMERAFNFADNQILQIYGFRHQKLGSAKVKRTRNETALPLEVKDEFNIQHPSFTGQKSL
ncbi:hypothetical protein SUGI_0436360 [Cryptomeria japonica]|uniref:probable xyloglucan 6-xylosyltransferase 5 n=1 Tax=Cryptomeria japonica TaxID=3369 RepID=UPI002408E7BF|nr:probable xyloglucan 6-xylosyltransferase 5 [Cryptomeria japonica]GLJ23123.1 hypothetical protein SUGI_0436360 [Cryptomeria japonica]